MIGLQRIAMMAGSGADKYSVSGFSDTERFYTGDNLGPQANLTYFACSIVIKPNANQTTNNWQFMAGKSNSNSNKVGYGFAQFQGACAFFCDGTFVGNNAGDDFFCYATSQGELNQLQLLTGVIYANKIYLFANGKLTGWGPYRGVTKSSYASTTRGVCIGAFSQPGAPTNYAPYDSSIYCFQIYENGIGSVASLDDVKTQVEAHYQAKLSNIYAQSTGCTHSWDARDAGAAWLDSVAGLDCARVGSIAPAIENIPWYPRYDADAVVNETRQYSAISGTVKVMALGTSRTIGGHVSYRMGIWLAAQESGDLDIDFVGTLSFDEMFPDGQYQAYGGTTFEQMLNGGSGHVAIATAMAAHTPHVVIIEGAVNALPDYDSLKQDCLDLCRAIYTADNDCRILLMDEHVGLRKSSVYDAKIRDFNNWKNRTAIPLLISEGVKMLTSDPVYADTIDPKIDIKLDADLVHWNQGGMFKMANKLYQPIRLAVGLNRNVQTIENTMVTAMHIKNDIAAHTGTVAETKLDSFLIPANYFSVMDNVVIEFQREKIGAVGNATIRVKANTTDAIGGTTILSMAASSGQLTEGGKRTMRFKNSRTAQVVFPAAELNTPDEVTAFITAVSHLTIDFTVDQYIMITEQLGSALDQSLVRWSVKLEREL